jgi:hypothetical protein
MLKNPSKQTLDELLDNGAEWLFFWDENGDEATDDPVSYHESVETEIYQRFRERYSMAQLLKKAQHMQNTQRRRYLLSQIYHARIEPLFFISWQTMTTEQLQAAAADLRLHLMYDISTANEGENLHHDDFFIMKQDSEALLLAIEHLLAAPRRLAIAMSSHTRLGNSSPLQHLDPHLMQHYIMTPTTCNDESR